MFSLESPHRGDSNKYAQYTIFNIEKKITLNNPKSAAMGILQETQNEFETAVVYESSVFEPLSYTVLAGDQWWPFFVTFYFLVTEILRLVIQYFGSIN